MLEFYNDKIGQKLNKVCTCHALCNYIHTALLTPVLSCVLVSPSATYARLNMTFYGGQQLDGLLSCSSSDYNSHFNTSPPLPAANVCSSMLGQVVTLLSIYSIRLH